MEWLLVLRTGREVLGDFRFVLMLASAICRTHAVLLGPIFVSSILFVVWSLAVAIARAVNTAA